MIPRQGFSAGGFGCRIRSLERGGRRGALSFAPAPFDAMYHQDMEIPRRPVEWFAKKRCVERMKLEDIEASKLHLHQRNYRAENAKSLNLNVLSPALFTSYARTLVHLQRVL